MNNIIANDSVNKALADVNELSAICDADGAVIGYYSPNRAYAKAATQFDSAEMQRRKELGEDRLTAEQVLDHLKSLEQ